MMLLGGIFIAAILLFVILFFVLLAAYDKWREHYQANRRHVLHTTARDERLVLAERESMGRLRQLPAPGHTIYTDHNVWLPHTPAPALRPAAWVMPVVETESPLVADITDAAHPAPKGMLPAWVIEALNGHDGVDSCLDSIVMRALAPG